MLSRVADALYWMSRYVERAEHAARVLEMTRRALIDLQEVEPEAAEDEWEAARAALGLPACEMEQATVDASLQGSVASCIARARENGRHVREVISAEMWDYLNQAYWALDDAGRLRRRREVLADPLADVVRASFLWGGATDATMGRGEGWLFIRLGQFVERADRTIRLFNVRWGLMHDRPAPPGPHAGGNVGWLTLLRGCCAFEEFRKRYPTRLEPQHVVEFLILDRSFPRTVAYSLAVAGEFAQRLESLNGERGRSVARAFGKLGSRLEYAELSELLRDGPDRVLDDLHGDLAVATLVLQRAYFQH